MKLEDLDYASFSQHVGSVFRLHTEGTVHEIRLDHAAVHGETRERAGGGRRQPFSIVFVGPPDLHIPQATYSLEHEQLGNLEIFLVPIQPTPEETRFEAVFT